MFKLLLLVILVLACLCGHFATAQMASKWITAQYVNDMFVVQITLLCNLLGNCM